MEMIPNFNNRIPDLSIKMEKMPPHYKVNLLSISSSSIHANVFNSIKQQQIQLFSVKNENVEFHSKLKNEDLQYYYVASMIAYSPYDKGIMEQFIQDDEIYVCENKEENVLLVFANTDNLLIDKNEEYIEQDINIFAYDFYDAYTKNNQNMCCLGGQSQLEKQQLHQKIQQQQIQKNLRQSHNPYDKFYNPERVASIQSDEQEQEMIKEIGKQFDKMYDYSKMQNSNFMKLNKSYIDHLKQQNNDRNDQNSENQKLVIALQSEVQQLENDYKNQKLVISKLQKRCAKYHEFLLSNNKLYLEVTENNLSEHVLEQQSRYEDRTQHKQQLIEKLQVEIQKQIEGLELKDKQIFGNNDQIRKQKQIQEKRNKEFKIQKNLKEGLYNDMKVYKKLCQVKYSTECDIFANIVYLPCQHQVVCENCHQTLNISKCPALRNLDDDAEYNEVTEISKGQKFNIFSSQTHKLHQGQCGEVIDKFERIEGYNKNHQAIKVLF